MMSRHAWLGGLLGLFLVWTGCSEATLTPSKYRVPLVDAASQSSCPPCATDQDCEGGTCAQLGGDSYCAPLCPKGNECDSDRACIEASSVSGRQVSVCVPRNDVCSQVAEDDAGAPPVSDHCGTLVGPKVSAACTSCSGKSDCQANGCFGGWWCDTGTKKCQAPPSTCGATAGEPLDAGPPVTGNVTATGGTLSRLLFAVVGDTRPASIDDTAGYPRAIISKIYSDIQAFEPRPPFTIATGDYIFASLNRTESAAQFDAYLEARNQFSGVNFPAMGNHECTGYTNSNCGPGTSNGTPDNYKKFMEKMLGPIEKSDPYYSIDVKASDASWTAKFVFIAPNAWTSTQETWLESALGKDTTYTFIVRHEGMKADTAPGVTPSEQIMARHPYTLAIVGHTHTYEHFSGREVIVGNGGAPITGSKSYGFGVFHQRTDGAIQVDMVDYSTGKSDTRFRFAVKPDGSPTP
jgi:hypothetical protein